MSLVEFILPKEYGLVLGAATLSFAVNFWHGARIGKFRKAAQIPYPNHYPPSLVDATSKEPLAKEQYLYQCAQRSHGNFIENQPSFLASMFIAGLKYPTAAGALGLAWNVARVMYAVGYTSASKQNGKGRIAGIWFFLVQIALIGLSGATAYQVMTA